ncbi:MAG: nitric oxide reductase transcriptional regulator NorR [Burkholderiaceae bacterium]
MTTPDWLPEWIGLVADLSRQLPDARRFGRLLEAVRRSFPCDATALLRLDGDRLRALAIDGLSADTMGRTFRLGDQPRLAEILRHDGPLRFAADSRLPDPFDGLVLGQQAGLEVHDCMGCTLYVEGAPWGLLTIDALGAGRFGAEDELRLDAFCGLASATVAAVSRIQRLERLAESGQLQLERYRRAAGSPGRSLLGQSAAFRRMAREIRLVAPSELTVLITGETGVGKELVAQALHARSTRSAEPMVSLNCAALPDTLVESELFGHVRGAFTGATAERRGKFELADGGTLFLDEVGELSLRVQAKLLRVLQSGQLQRLGSDREHHVDVRLIAATNRDLAEEVRAGRMRADIYHRLSVFPLRVPALRERGRDVLLLAGHFLEENRARLGLGTLRLDEGAQQALLACAWPGNVRELEHLIGRSVLRALDRGDRKARVTTLTSADLGLPVSEARVVAAGVSASTLMSAPVPASSVPTAPRTSGERTSGERTSGERTSGERMAPADGVPAEDAGDAAEVGRPQPSGSLRDAVDDCQRALVRSSLQRHHGNWAAAARELDVDRANLVRLARRLGVVPPGPITRR